MTMSKNLPLFFRTITTFVVAASLSSCSTHTPLQQTAPLRILHWNDFHAHNLPFEVSGKDSLTGKPVRYKVGGTANLVAYLDALGRGDPHVAVFFGGDDFQGTPVSGLTKGRSQLELMNMIRPDAAVLGNHEFDYGLQQIRNTVAQARYPILAANLFDSSIGTTFCTPTLVKSFGAVRVGLIGLLPLDLPILTLASTLAGTSMLDVDSLLNVHIRRLREVEKVNLVILLSHMGVGVDTVLAAHRRDIDIIVGGHSHTPLFTPIRKGRTVVVQAGSSGRYVGKLDCVVDLQGDSLRSYSGSLVETRLGIHPADSSIQQKVLEFEDLVTKDLDEVIGTLTTDWKTAFDEECNTGDWEADVFRAYAGTDIALVNSGGLRKSMFAGPIKKRDIWEMNPFGNTLITFALSGDQLMKMLEWQAARKGELMQVSGLQYAFDPRAPAGQKIIHASVNSQPIEPHRTYTFVTNNYVAGHAERLLGVAPEAVKDLSVSDKDVLIEYIMRHKTISSEVEGRILQRLPPPELEPPR
jgi:5'-nucleotidase/UDP-sugar diphosphatase